MDVLARIILRYVAGFLLYKGFVSTDMSRMIQFDPDLINWLQIALGLAAGGLAEGWYWLAKKFGWKT